MVACKRRPMEGQLSGIHKARLNSGQAQRATCFRSWGRTVSGRIAGLKREMPSQTTSAGGGLRATFWPARRTFATQQLVRVCIHACALEVSLHKWSRERMRCEESGGHQASRVGRMRRRPQGPWARTRCFRLRVSVEPAVSPRRLARQRPQRRRRGQPSLCSSAGSRRGVGFPCPDPLIRFGQRRSTWLMERGPAETV